MKLTFELDIAPTSDDSEHGDIPAVIKTAIDAGAISARGIPRESFGYDSVKITAPDEPTAYAIVDAFYGPESSERDSNHFFVYGE